MSRTAAQQVRVTGTGRLAALHPRPGGAERAAVDVRRADRPKRRSTSCWTRCRPRSTATSSTCDCPARRPERARLAARGARCPSQLAEVRAATAADADGSDAQLVPGRPAALVPGGGDPRSARERGRLWPAAARPLDPETDRVLVRSAANVVGTTLATANVLEVARRKDDFLAMLGHELRNPLAPIMTAVELLARQPVGRPRAATSSNGTPATSPGSSTTCSTSRASRAATSSCGRNTVSLASVLERAVEIAAPLIVRHRHALEVADRRGHDAAGRSGPARADLRQPADERGEVHAARRAHRRPRRARARRAGPRHRARQRPRHRARSAGADLRAVRAGRPRARRAPRRAGPRPRDREQPRRAARRHIAAHSDGRVGAPPSPSSFRPRRAPPSGPRSCRRPRPSVARAGVRVLVVDDNVDIAELLSEALQDEGFQTAVAHDGARRARAWRSFVPHAAVLDVGLPDSTATSSPRRSGPSTGRRPR